MVWLILLVAFGLMPTLLAGAKKAAASRGIGADDSDEHMEADDSEDDSFFSFDEDDERLYQGLNLWTDYSRRADKNMTKQLQKILNSENKMARKRRKKPQTGWAKNQVGVMVKKCCLTCPFWDENRSKKSRLCMEVEKVVDRYHICETWEMTEGLQQAGSGNGVVRDIATKKVVIK